MRKSQDQEESISYSDSDEVSDNPNHYEVNSNLSEDLTNKFNKLKQLLNKRQLDKFKREFNALAEKDQIALLKFKTPGNSDDLLHMAATVGNLPITQYLLGLGASTSEKNQQGYTAYDVAIKTRHNQVATLLRIRTQWAEEQRKQGLQLNLNRTLHLLSGAKESVKQAKDKDIVLVLGETGVGKSTLLSYLNGARYQLEGFEGFRTLKLVSGKEIAKVGYSNTTSQTVYPQLVQTKQKDNDDLNLVDLAGLNGSRDPETELAGTLSTHLLSKMASRIKGILFVISKDELQVSRGDKFRETVKTLNKILGNQTIYTASQSIYFAITKCPYSVPTDFIANEYLQPMLELLGKNLGKKKYISKEDKALYDTLSFMIQRKNSQVFIPNVCDKGESGQKILGALNRSIPIGYYAFSFAAKELPKIKSGKNIYLYRYGKPEKIYALVSHQENLTETLCLSDIVKKSGSNTAANFLKKLRWPTYPHLYILSSIPNKAMREKVIKFMAYTIRTTRDNQYYLGFCHKSGKFKETRLSVTSNLIKDISYIDYETTITDIKIIKKVENQIRSYGGIVSSSLPETNTLSVELMGLIRRNCKYPFLSEDSLNLLSLDKHQQDFERLLNILTAKYTGQVSSIQTLSERLKKLKENIRIKQKDIKDLKTEISECKAQLNRKITDDEGMIKDNEAKVKRIDLDLSSLEKKEKSLREGIIVEEKAIKELDTYEPVQYGKPYQFKHDSEIILTKRSLWNLWSSTKWVPKEGHNSKQFKSLLPAPVKILSIDETTTCTEGSFKNKIIEGNKFSIDYNYPYAKSGEVTIIVKIARRDIPENSNKIKSHRDKIESFEKEISEIKESIPQLKKHKSTLKLEIGQHKTNKKKQIRIIKQTIKRRIEWLENGVSSLKDDKIQFKKESGKLSQLKLELWVNNDVFKSVFGMIELLKLTTDTSYVNFVKCYDELSRKIEKEMAIKTFKNTSQTFFLSLKNTNKDRYRNMKETSALGRILYHSQCKNGAKPDNKVVELIENHLNFKIN